jgi:hypothetical protein
LKSNRYLHHSLAFLAICCSPAVSLAADYYVSPSGSSAGTGSISSPWDFQTACAPAAAVKPGDTVWLRGGTYGTGGMTTQSCSLAGSSAQPVYVRQYPGERATVNGGLGIYGNYVWYWGFEVTNTNWTRSTAECGSFPSIKVSDGVYFTQGIVGVKLINLVVHDAANGISDQQEASGTEDYGNILYNNGWASSCDRGHGHSLYMQNAASTVKLIQDNIGFNSFDIGMQAYGGVPISHLHFLGNVMFNSGVPGGHRVDNFLVEGGSVPKQDILFDTSVAYNPLDATPAETGYNQFMDGSNLDLTMTNNYWIGATPTGYMTMQIQGWQTMTFTGNMVVGPILTSNVGFTNWSGNTYYNSAPPSGVDTASPVIGHNPTGVNVIVRPNKYEPGRANIIVMNWDKTSSVTVNLSGSGLAVGSAFEILDAQNFYGSPVLTGTYSGSPIVLPMNQTAVTAGINFTAPAHTSTEFGAFVLLPLSSQSSGSGTVSTVSVSVSPASASLSAGATKQFTASVGGSSNTAVTWSLSSAIGSISSTGLYTAPSTASTQQTVTVIATSQADSTKTASATVTIAPSSSSSGSSSGTGSGTTAGSTVGLWTFDTSTLSGSTALDSSGNGLNGTMYNVTQVAGAVNQALSFNGSTSLVSVPYSTKYQLRNSMTVSAWIKTTNSSRTENFLGNYDAGGMEWGYLLKTLPSGVVGLRVGGNNVAGNRDVADTTRINDGQWHHVAVVINLGQTVQFYIDGALSTTQSMPTVAAGNSVPLWIGTPPFPYFGQPFTGALDNVEIDNQALSAAAIAQLAGKSGSSSTGSSSTGSSSTGSSSGSSSTGSSTSGGSSSSSTLPAAYAGAAAFWSFDSADISGSTIKDDSGNGLNGTMSNLTIVTGRDNQAFSFNGVNSLVSVPDNASLELTHSLTLSAWIKTTNTSRTEDFLGAYNANATETGYMLKVLPSGMIDLRVGGNNVSGTRDVAGTVAINDGQWHHIAVVINLGQNVQFYVDGTLRSTSTMLTAPAASGATFWIGTPPFPYFGQPFTGALDNVRVDSQALSAATIAQLATL